MKLSIKLRNLLYWFRSLFTNYQEVQIELDDAIISFLYVYAAEQEMTLNQVFENILKTYMKKWGNNG